MKKYEDSQKMTSGANAISRPHSGQKFNFMPGNFDTVGQLPATNKLLQRALLYLSEI